MELAQGHRIAAHTAHAVEHPRSLHPAVQRPPALASSIVGSGAPPRLRIDGTERVLAGRESVFPVSIVAWQGLGGIGVLDYEAKSPMSAEFSLGTYLRRGRERSGLSVDAISSGSRIVPQLIQALEADRFDLLPAPVYVRGFIRAYCEQVGVDAEGALRRYEAHVASTPAPPLRSPPPTLAPRRPARRWRPAAAGAALLAALGMVAIFAVVRGRQPDAAASRGPAPPVARSSVPAPPGVSAARVPSTAGAPGQASSPPAASAVAPVPVERVLLMRAVDATWVRVAPEGAPVTEETLPPGAVREWRSAGRFRVSLGDAAGVEIELDGEPVPALGRRGQVVHRTIPDEARP